MFSPKNVNFQIPEDIKLYHATSTYGSVFRGDTTTGFRGVSIFSISEFRGDGQGNDFCRMAWSRNSNNSQTNSTIYSSLLWLKQTMLFPDNQIVSQLPAQMHNFHDSRDNFKCHQKDRHTSNAIEVEKTRNCTFSWIKSIVATFDMETHPNHKSFNCQKNYQPVQLWKAWHQDYGVK